MPSSYRAKLAASGGYNHPGMTYVGQDVLAPQRHRAQIQAIQPAGAGGLAHLGSGCPPKMDTNMGKKGQLFFVGVFFFFCFPMVLFDGTGQRQRLGKLYEYELSTVYTLSEYLCKWAVYCQERLVPFFSSTTKSQLVTCNKVSNSDYYVVMG